MMLKDKVKIETYLTLDERDALTEIAKQLHLSRAEYLKRVALGTPLPNIGNKQTIVELSKVNADMARLGNLLKLALDNIDVDGLQISTLKINQIMAELEDAKQILKTKIKEL